MRGVLTTLKARVRGLSYGFLVIPGAMVIGSACLAFGLVQVDRAFGPAGKIGIADDPEAARRVLTVIGGSLITVAGLTFSITMVTLQLVSQQFTPRALRGFLGDRLNQAMAGCFVGAFVYSLVVLRTVDGTGGPADWFVPSLSVTVAMVMAVAALFGLLLFIDHMARSIQVSSISAGIARATLKALDSLYPSAYGEPAGRDGHELIAEWARRPQRARQVFPSRPGYVQLIVMDDIVREAGPARADIHVCVAPGQFVTERQPVAEYWMPDGDVESVERALRLAVHVANERGLEQEPAYGLRQLRTSRPGRCLRASTTRPRRTRASDTSKPSWSGWPSTSTPHTSRSAATPTTYESPAPCSRASPAWHAGPPRPAFRSGRAFSPMRPGRSFTGRLAGVISDTDRRRLEDLLADGLRAANASAAGPHAALGDARQAAGPERP